MPKLPVGSHLRWQGARQQAALLALLAGDLDGHSLYLCREMFPSRPGVRAAGLAYSLFEFFHALELRHVACTYALMSVTRGGARCLARRTGCYCWPLLAMGETENGLIDAGQILGSLGQHLPHLCRNNISNM